MKKRFIIHSTLFILLVMAISFANAQTVYVTGSGKKFHKKNCSVVSEGKKGINLADAKKQGYSACNVCKPEAIATDPKKKK